MTRHGISGINAKPKISLNAMYSPKVRTDYAHPEAAIKQFFKKAHLFVAPFIETEGGDKDGIPTSLLEAMASGLPVIATDAGSIREVIDDGRDVIDSVDR